MIAAILEEKKARACQSNQGGNSVTMAASEKLAQANDDIKSLSTIFKLLSDETRLKILFSLREADEMNVLELCGILGQRQPSVSHHLALLRVNGLIGMRRDGKHNFYHIRPARMDEVVELVLKVATGRASLASRSQSAEAFSSDEATA